MDRRSMCALIAEHQQMDERPGFGIESLAIVRLAVFRRRFGHADQLSQREARSVAQRLQMPGNRRTEQHEVVADDRVAHHDRPVHA